MTTRAATEAELKALIAEMGGTFQVFRDEFGGSFDCRDSNSMCERWAAAGECDRNPGYMRLSCKRSCGVCGVIEQHHQTWEDSLLTAKEDDFEATEENINSGNDHVYLDPARVAWLHVPKTGTSFANMMGTWACPGMLENDTLPLNMVQNLQTFIRAGECRKGFSFDLHSRGKHVPILDDSTIELWKEEGDRIEKKLGGGRGKLRFSEMLFEKNPGLAAAKQHAALGPTFDQNYIPNIRSKHSPYFVGMFRQPEDRMLSGYLHGHHGMYSKYKLGQTLLEYGEAVSGCATKMLSGYGCYAEMPVTPQMLTTAVSRIQDDFAFVGLTGEWALSVCLWHAMFEGPPCHVREFMNMRSTRKHAQYPQLKEQLKGWTDPLDGAVYEAATKRFHAEFERRGLSLERCQREVCPTIEAKYWSPQRQIRQKPKPKSRPMSQSRGAAARGAPQPPQRRAPRDEL